VTAAAGRDAWCGVGAWQAAARLDLVASQAGGGVRGREAG